MNSNELPTPGTHMFTVNKFLSGFIFYGYEKIIATKLDDIEDGGIVLLSNHGLDHATISKEVGLNTLKYLADKYPNCIYICWYFHQHYENIPFKRFVITGEHFRSKPGLKTHIKFWDFQRTINNYVPLTFASNLFPDQVASYERTDTLNGCFMGTEYKKNWVQGLTNIVYLRGLCHGTEINEDDRIKIFLSSKIAFGFHSDGNILNNVVVERVFEGMAYGCVVISDSPVAGLITNGIVQVATNKEEFLEVYNKILSDNDLRLDLQKRGYEWVKNNGLYVHTVKRFIDKFEEI